MTLAMQQGATYDCSYQISTFDMSLKFGPDDFSQNLQKHRGKEKKLEEEQRSSLLLICTDE